MAPVSDRLVDTGHAHIQLSHGIHHEMPKWRQPFDEEHARLRSESYGVATESSRAASEPCMSKWMKKGRTKSDGLLR